MFDISAAALASVMYVAAFYVADSGNGKHLMYSGWESGVGKKVLRAERASEQKQKAMGVSMHLLGSARGDTTP